MRTYQWCARDELADRFPRPSRNWRSWTDAGEPGDYDGRLPSPKARCCSRHLGSSGGHGRCIWPHHRWLSGAAVGSVILFVMVEVWQREPLVDLSLFKTWSFTGTNITVLLFGIALQGATLIAVLYFTNALGYSQLHAAYALIPIALASFVASLLAGKLSSKVTPSMMCLAGMALVAIGLGLLGLLSTEASFM